MERLRACLNGPAPPFNAERARPPFGSSKRVIRRIQGHTAGRNTFSRRLAVVLILLAPIVAPVAEAQAETCQRTDFEAVVDEASSTLVTQTRANTPTFQAKLRALKEKRGWSNDQLIKEGAAFVRDDKIAAFDDQSEQLLLKINTQGGDSADCKVLADLKLSMQRLVEAQQAKWKYMFEKIDAELAR